MNFRYDKSRFRDRARISHVLIAPKMKYIDKLAIPCRSCLITLPFLLPA